MKPPTWLLAVLRRSRLPRTPKRTNPGELPGVYRSANASQAEPPPRPLSLEDDLRPIAPPADRHDATQALPLADIRAAAEHAADRFPHNAATPRGRGGSRVYGAQADDDWPQNRGRFQ